MDLYIFGTKRNAEMAKFYFERDYPQYNLMGFIEDNPSIDEAYGLQVFQTDMFLKTIFPEHCLIFAPITTSSLRKVIFQKFKSCGYSFASYISPDSNIWNIDAVGENCFIQEFNNIQFGSYISDNCLLWAGNHIGHHGKIGSHTTFTSHVTLSGGCTIGNECYFGVNSTIGDGLSICDMSFIGMGSLVTKDIIQSGVYVGAPARWLKSSKGII